MLKIIKVLLFIIVINCVTLFANDNIGELKTIRGAIESLNPYLDENIAEKCATIIDKYGKEYNVSWKILVIIFTQESNFNIKAINWASRDFGIGQMNYTNIMQRGIDLGLLLTDLDYAILQTVKFLSELKIKYNTNSRGWLRWYTRYHSFTPSFRKKYYRILRGHFNRVEEYLKESLNEQKDNGTRTKQRNPRGNVSKMG